MVHQVAAGENPGQVGAGARRIDEDVTLVVQVDLTSDQLGAGIVANGDEQTGDGEFPGVTGDGVFNHNAVDLVITEHIHYLGIPHRLDLLVGQDTLGHHLAGTQLIAPVDEVDLVREASEKGCFLRGRVSTPDDSNLLLPEEEAVAGRAPGNPVPRQTLLVLQTKLPVPRTHREDHCVGGVGVPRTVGHRLDVSVQIYRGDIVGDEFSTETFGLLAHFLH